MKECRDMLAMLSWTTRSTPEAEETKLLTSGLLEQRQLFWDQGSLVLKGLLEQTYVKETKNLELREWYYNNRSNQRSYMKRI